MEILLTSIYLTLILLLIKKWKFFKSKQLSIKLLTGLFIVKFAMGLFVFWIYSGYYSNNKYNRHDADIFKYYDDSEVIYNSLKSKPLDFTQIILGLDFNKDYFSDEYYINMNNWDTHYKSHIFNDARVIIRINAFFRIFTFGFYSIHILFFCFISFLGLFALFKATSSYIASKEKLFFICLSLTPSILFWSSAVLKEPLMIYAVGFILLYFKNVKTDRLKIVPTIHLLICLLILFFLKFYVFCILIVLLIPFSINSLKDFRFKVVPYFLCFLFFTSLTLLLKKVDSKFDIAQLIEQKQASFISESKYKNAGSYFEITDLNPDYQSIVKAIPIGIINSLSRPLIWKVKKLIQVPSAIENIFFISFILMSIINILKNKSILAKHTNLLLFCLFFVLINYALIGIITPISGALVRYKIIALPFLIILLLKTTHYNPLKSFK